MLKSLYFPLFPKYSLTYTLFQIYSLSVPVKIPELNIIINTLKYFSITKEKIFNRKEAWRYSRNKIFLWKCMKQDYLLCDV